jgi:predicted RNA-binding Zn-ribbon protein involved in translation (DUF1610 family)
MAKRVQIKHTCPNCGTITHFIDIEDTLYTRPCSQCGHVVE